MPASDSSDALCASLSQGWRAPCRLLRLGLFLYDHLGGRKKLPATRTLDMRTDPSSAPLKPLLQRLSNIRIAGWMMRVLLR